jgi:hypothetical protein
MNKEEKNLLYYAFHEKPLSGHLVPWLRFKLSTSQQVFEHYCYISLPGSRESACTELERTM